MATISISPPYAIYNDVEGASLEDASIYIGTTGLNPLIQANQIAVYSNAALTIPVAQPVRTSGGYPVASGTPVQLYAGAADYSIVILDKNGSLVHSSLSNKTKFGLIDLSTDVTGLLGYTFIRYDQTPAELAVGATPVNLYRPPGDIRRFAVFDGIADDTIAVQTWASVPGYHYGPSGTVLISAAITNVASNSNYEFDEGFVVKSNTINISLFVVTGKTNVKFRGGKLLQTAAGATANLGLIVFDSCIYVRVLGVEFQGAQWAGVWFNNTIDGKVLDDCYFHDFLGTVQDSSDVIVYRNCVDIEVAGNRLYGGNYAGVLVQDPDGGTIPLHTNVHHNKVGPHSAYGLVTYCIAGSNNFTVFDTNAIEGITGVNPGGAGGAPIYIQNSGGAKAIGNTCKDSCTATNASGLTPAGIGVNNINLSVAVTFTAGLAAAAVAGTLTANWTGATGKYNVNFVETVGGALELRTVNLTNGSTAVTWTPGLAAACNASASTLALIPPIIAGNTFTGIGNNNLTVAVNIACINISSSTAGANIGPNTYDVRLGSSGAAAVAGKYAILVNASDNVSINGGNAYVDPAITGSAGIVLFANGRNITGFEITGIGLLGAASSGVTSVSSAAFTIGDLTVNGVRHSGGGAACISYRLGLVAGGALNGCRGTATTVQALDINTCTDLRVAGGSMISTGADAIVTGGVCTGSYIDKSLRATGSGGSSIEAVKNAATGLIVEQLGNAQPAVNNRAVGDRVEQSVPVVGQPKGWRNTVAGTAGTNPSEGNL